MRPIDPIKVRERHSRIASRITLLERAQKAAKALGWFADYAQGSSPGTLKEHELLRGGPQLVASSTSNVDVAQHYVDRAMEQFRDDVMRRAIELAQAEFDMVEEDK